MGDDPPASSVHLALSQSATDRGHRLGNFHNYYAFHPPPNRLDVLTDCGIVNYIVAKRGGKTSNGCKRRRVESPAEEGKEAGEEEEEEAFFWYCDLGCNEGDLTLGLSDVLSTKFSETSDGGKSGSATTVRCLGLDVDPILIRRAQEKMDHTVRDGTNETRTTFGDVATACAPPTVERDLSANPTNNASNGKINGNFEVCNLCNAVEHTSKCRTFLDGRRKRFDLTTIFSTTMWIHLHSGDEGLRSFLERACEMTELLLVEPQPSRCYRQANVRLRKMNLPELPNVSSGRLQMRLNIETEIESVIVKCGFRRVSPDDGDVNGDIDIAGEHSRRTDDTDTEGGSGKKKRDKEGREEGGSAKRTAWNRALQLYERVVTL